MDLLILILLGGVLAVLVWLGISQKRINYLSKRNKDDEAELFSRKLEEMENRHRLELELLRSNFETQRHDLMQQYEKQTQQIRNESASQFEILSRKVFEDEKERLKAVNREGIEALLQPLKSRIEEFQRLVTDAHNADTKGRENLAGQVEQLMRLNLTIGQEARNLTSALKGDSKVQGDWGENILATILEKAGLVEGIHFDTQLTRDASGQVLRNETGNALRPDAVIYLPDRRSLIVDSKVSLTAFTDYCNAEDEDSRRNAGKRHLESVKKHIKELADKHYPDVVANAADHVVMFMPLENAYMVALRLDPTLWSYAYSRKVAIVTPVHLFSTLQIVSQLWTRDDQNRHVAKIAEAGGKLYDKLATFCKTFEKIDNSLTAARTAYDEALSQLCTGKGNAIKQASAMKELGAKATKAMPKKFEDLAEASEQSIV